MRWIAVAVAVSLSGCRCGERQPEVEVPEASHFGRFHGLVNAAVTGDVEDAQWIARSLQEGDVPEVAGDGGGAEKVGGGLGFIQIAEDAEEVTDGLAAAAIGCGLCHAAAGVERPPMGTWSHQTAGLRMVLGATFPPAEPPPPQGAELEAVRAAWESAETDEEKLAAALGACVSCHAKGAE